jgi:hypothetical protein
MIAELACRELTRRWKQRPEFGPVALVCTDEPMRPTADNPTRAVFVQSELCRNNEVAIRRALRLRATQEFVNPLIIDEGGGIVWSTPDLLCECDKRRETSEISGETVGAEAIEGQDRKDRPDGRLGRRDDAVAVTLTRAKK